MIQFEFISDSEEGHLLQRASHNYLIVTHFQLTWPENVTIVIRDIPICGNVQLFIFLSLHINILIFKSKVITVRGI